MRSRRQTRTPRTCATWIASIATALCVSHAAVATTFEVRVANGNDDAEEDLANGNMNLTSSDLELGQDPDGCCLTDMQGMRFLSVTVPPGATITNAYVQFTVDETDSNTMNLTIYGQDADDPGTFTSTNSDLSNRPTTTASVAWAPVAWNSAGAAGTDQRTPDLSAIIQEIVDRGGWSSGNDMVIIVTGTGERTAESYNGSTSQAPLLHIEYTVGAGGVGGSGGLPGGTYVENFQQWSASSSGSWQTASLSGSPYDVPANAVVEVLVRNIDTGNERLGGVRAVGSSLTRRFDIAEAEAGGWESVTMHVQTNASSQIQHYAEDTGDIRFYLLGYWTQGTYVEAMQTVSATSTNTWHDKNLSGYGVSAGEVAEFVMTNDNTSNERLAGVRTNGSSLQRRIDVVKAQGGGVALATMHAMADDTASATVEVYAENTGDVSFTMVGYWSEPPLLTYVELFTDVGSPGSDGSWADLSLTGDGVPPDTVTEFALVNRHTSAENNMGVRADGSTLSRYADVQEAEGDGHAAARMHVTLDETADLEFYHEDVSEAHTFYLTGYWHGTGRLLFVVPDPSSLATGDASRRTEFEAQGWVVDLIDESDSQGQFDTAMGPVDVVYVTENVDAGTLGTKLTAAELGVLVENARSFDDLGIIDNDGSTYSGTQIDVQSVSHYITDAFSAGNVTMTTSSQTLNSTSEAVTRGGQVLAEQPSSSNQALITIDWCREVRGRRVFMPWGGATFDWSKIDTDGLTVLHRSLVWASGKVAHWRLDETSGTTAYDTSGYGNDATLTNMAGTEWTNGRVEGALTFDGSADYLVDSDFEAPTNAFTYSLWFRPTATLTSASAREDLLYGVTGTRPHLTFNKVGNGEVGLFVNVNGTDYDDVVTTTTSWSSAAWHHVVFTWDGTDFRVFVDGVQEGSNVTHAGTHATSTGINIGRRTSGNYFDGRIDDIRIYRIALSPDEVAQLYTACSTPTFISWQEVAPQ